MSEPNAELLGPAEGHHLSVDIETVAVSSDAAIVSIGAVWFTKDAVGERFFELVDWRKDLDTGGRVDQSTLDWWARQDVRARSQLGGNGRVVGSLSPVLHRLSDFIQSGPKVAGIWSMGIFDFPILDSAFERALVGRSWRHWDQRCARTLLKTAGVKVEFLPGETAHVAVDDAAAQARAIQVAWRKLGVAAGPVGNGAKRSDGANVCLASRMVEFEEHVRTTWPDLELDDEFLQAQYKDWLARKEGAR